MGKPVRDVFGRRASGPRAGRHARAASALAVVVALAAAACGGPAENSPTVTVDPDVTAPKSGPPTPDIPPAWPLTGVAFDDVAPRAALAVKIENSAAARPQAGLEHADIVWEEVVEGGITRFVAVYHSQTPELVGPVRSVRPMDPAIVAPMHGILAYTGAQQPFIDAVNAAGIQSVVEDQGDDGFERVRSRRAPHNVMGRLGDFWAQADADRAAPPPAQFEYARAAGKSTAATAGTPAGLLDVSLSPSSRAQWQWSPDDGAFLRSEGTQPAVSAEGVRLSAKNVVLLNVTMVNTGFKDPAGAPVPETQLVGTGDGAVASEGQSVPVTWSKTAVDAPLVLTGADGKTVHLEPGNTWVELVPIGSGSITIG